MGKSQRTKGYRGEREAVLLLEKYGFEARRRQGNEHQGADLDTDIGMIEVKRRSAATTLLYAALKTDAMWVLHRDDREDWLISAPAEFVLGLMRDLRRVFSCLQANDLDGAKKALGVGMGADSGLVN